MDAIKFHIVQPGDQQSFQLIAGWYLQEWKIPVEQTMQRLKEITTDKFQVQVLMTLNDIPVCTGGLYNHVGLVDKEPGFKIYRNWLALVYSIPGQRGKGYGALICQFIQEHSKQLGLKQMYLFTDTAEPLYHRLGWTVLQRLAMGNRNIVVMTLALI